MALIRNPSSGEISIVDDPTGLLEQGYELATPEQANEYAKQVDFGTPGQTAQALGERMVRGGTLGLVEGFGDDADIQARADVSQEQHPALSFAADVAPDLAVGAITGGLGEAAAGAAGLGRAAAGVAGLAAESAGSGAVMAGQQAFAEGRDAWSSDISTDAENALIWGGLNFGLGSIGLAREGLREARAAKAGAQATEEGLEDIAHAEEAKSFRPQLEGEPAPPQLGAGSDPSGITPGGGAPELPPAVEQLNPLESLGSPQKEGLETITTQGEPVGDFAPPVSQPLAGAADQGNAVVTAPSVPLGNVQLPDSDGMLERAAPEAITPEVAADIDRVANGALVGKSLDDLKALPLDSGPGAAESRAKVDAFKADSTFQAEGRLPGNNDNARGGLPRFNLYQEDGAEKLYLVNGRHRLTAASEMGKDSIQAHIVSHDAEGNALWDYVGPVKIGEATADGGDKASRIADLSKQFSEMTGLGAGQVGAGRSSRAEARGKVRLYRAAEDDSIGNTASFSPDVDTARAYHDNPGFGGKNLFQADVRINPKKLLDISADSQDAQLSALVKAAGIEHPGATTADQLLSRESVLGALRQKGIEWVKLTDTFPEGAETYTWIGGKEPKLSPFEASVAVGMGGDEISSKLAEFDRLMSIGHEDRAMRIRDLLEEGIPGSTWRDVIEKARTRAAQFSETTGLSAKQVGGVAAIGAAGALQGQGDTEGSAGAGLGVIGALLLGSKLFRGASRDGAKHAVEDGLERAVRNASRADADDVVARVIKGAADEPDSFGRQRRLYQNRAAIYDVAGRELNDAVGQVAKHAEGALDRGLSTAAKKVGQNLPAQLDAAQGIAEDAARFAGGLRAEAREYAISAGEGGRRYPVPGAKAFAAELMSQAKAVADAGTGREAFEALASFREVVSRFNDKLDGAAAKALDPSKVTALQAKVIDFSNRIRKTLERQDTWGAAGEMAAAHHAVDDQLRPVLSALSERSAAAALKGADPEKRALLQGALKAATELGQVETRFGDAAVGKKLGDAVGKAQRTLGLADEVADASERMQAINAVTPDLLNQFITGDVVGKFRRLAGATDASLDKSVDEWITSSRAPGAKAPSSFVSHEDDALMATAKRRGISRGMALFLGDDDSPTSAFLKKRDALMDEEKFFHELGQDFRSLQQQAPEAFMVMSAQASIARQFLLDKIPANVSVSMANPLGYPPSKDAIEDWSVYWNAIKYPREATRKLAAMRASEAETIRTVYPRYYEKLQQKALMRLGASQAMGHRIDDTVAFRLGMLFDIDGPGSPAFSQEAAKGVRAYNKQQAQAGGGARPPPAGQSNMQRLQSPYQSVIQNGPTFGGRGL